MSTTPIRISADFPGGETDEPIDVGRLLGRMYGKAQFTGRAVHLANGQTLRIGDRHETPLLIGRRQPASAVPMFLAEGLDRLRAAALVSGPDAAFAGLVVADDTGHVAAARAADGFELQTACSCGEGYCCSTQLAALVAFMASGEVKLASDNLDEQLCEHLTQLTMTAPEQRSVEPLLLACDAGYLALKDPAIKDDFTIHMQHRGLAVLLSDELRRVALDKVEQIGPMVLPTGAVLGQWGPELDRPALSPIIEVSTADIIATAQAHGLTPTGLLLDDD